VVVRPVSILRQISQPILLLNVGPAAQDLPNEDKPDPEPLRINCFRVVVFKVQLCIAETTLPIEITFFANKL